jgi:hypothetical protein
MGYLEPTWVLKDKIEKLPESKRKEKIQKFIKKQNVKSKGPGDFTALIHRGNLQIMMDNFKNDDHLVWNSLDNYLEEKEI